MDKEKLLQFLYSMVKDDSTKDWEDYDKGFYDGEQDTINSLIILINNGEYDK
jgi:hypothetical protein